MSNYDSSLQIKKFKITATKLKIIAILSMLIDHIGYMLIYNGKLYGYNPEILKVIRMESYVQNYLILYRVCRVAGRIAFPIFCYLLVEGFLHTSNFFKYFLRILIFAFISEIPFNLVLSNGIHYSAYQNILFTFCIGLVCMWIASKMRGDFLLRAMVFILGAILSVIIKADYSYWGIALIFVFYIFRYDKMWMFVFAFIICFLSSFIGNNYGAAVLALIPIALYDGKRGAKLPKYFFYIFYPLHLFILYLMVWIPYNLQNIK
ncbi:MAG: TraX family protein [Eubacteriales bacterium]|nr:TraX family protein [Eubacteriales bacterium]